MKKGSDEAELLRSAMTYMRSGALVIGLLAAGAGWYYSEEFGDIFLYGGIGVGIVLALLIGAFSSIPARILKKKIDEDEE